MMTTWMCRECCNEFTTARKPRACAGCGETGTLVRVSATPARRPVDPSLHTWDGPAPTAVRDQDGAPVARVAGDWWPE